MKKILLTVVLLGVVAMVMFASKPYTYNSKKAVDYITSHASNKSKGLCAKYVRLALEAGGCETWGHPFTAEGYNSFLKSLDFTCVDKNNYIPQPGDIVVFSAVKGHPFGHIAMWNGRQWISDFRQRGLFVANAYAKADNHKFYRNTKNNPERHYEVGHYINYIGDVIEKICLDVLKELAE